MPLIVCDPQVEKRLIARRKKLGLDRYDEVWDGVYVMSPLPNPEHQELIGDFVAALKAFIPRAEGRVYPGLNVSDRGKGWRKNYRCPDVAIYLKDNPVKEYKAHFCGGPDWAAEIVSPGDRSREKFDFYAKIGVRELLVIDREPWALELYVLKRKSLKLVGRSTSEDQAPLSSTLFPITFRLLPGEPRPLIEVATSGGKSPRVF